MYAEVKFRWEGVIESEVAHSQPATLSAPNSFLFNKLAAKYLNLIFTKPVKVPGNVMLYI